MELTRRTPGVDIKPTLGTRRPCLRSARWSTRSMPVAIRLGRSAHYLSDLATILCATRTATDALARVIHAQATPLRKAANGVDHAKPALVISNCNCGGARHR